MSEWQPIETAPKCEHVLVWDGEYVMDAWFHDDRWCIFRREFTNGMVSFWLDEDPTHWMPLPDGPGQ